MDAGHLALLAGAGSVVDLLCFALMDAGDAVLVPAPYYPAFDNDLMVGAFACPTIRGGATSSFGKIVLSTSFPT